MTWAARRRVVIFIIVAVVLLAAVSTLVISVVYKAPSCVDTVQNQNETGIDCGGPCPYLCTAQQAAPTVLYTKSVSNGAGRIDVVAAIENKNLNAAAKKVPYKVTVYGAAHVQLRVVTGTLDLPPASVTLVFIPGVAATNQRVENVFLEIDPSVPHWYTVATDPRIVPSVSNTRLSGTVTAPRVEALLSNSSIAELANVPVIVIIRDAQGTVIGASSTVVPDIGPQSQAVALFTWNGPFAGLPTAIEAVPIVPLP